MIIPLVACMACCASAVSITVVDMHGEPIPGAEVVLSASPDLTADVFDGGKTNEKGGWGCALPNAPSRIWIQASRVTDKKRILRSATIPVDIADEATSAITIKLDGLERSDYRRRAKSLTPAVVVYPCNVVWTVAPSACCSCPGSWGLSQCATLCAE